MEKKTKELIMLIIMITILVTAIILLTIKLINLNKKETTNKKGETNNLIIKNEFNNVDFQNNIQTENNINAIENEISINEQTENNNNTQNKVQSNNVNITIDETQEIPKEEIISEENKQESALEIARKDWGEDSTVYFSFEGIEDGKYIVCVREIATTRALRNYLIDLETKKFEIQ